MSKEHPPEAVDEKGELKCAAFGLDEAGKPGIDDGTEECQACLEQEPELYEACRQQCAGAEGQMGDDVEPEAPTEAPAAEEQPEQPIEAPEVPEDQSPELVGEEAAPEGAEEEGDSEMAKGKKKTEKAANKAKADKPKKYNLGQAVMNIILRTKSRGKFKRASIVEAALKDAEGQGRTETAVTCQVNFAVLYGIRFGIMKYDESDRGVVLWT